MTNTTGSPSAAELGLDVRPLAGHIGAEILGVDVSRPLDPAVAAEIRATLLRWKVVFFRDRDLTQTQHVAFGRQFGDVTPAHPTLPAAFPEHPEILLLDNRQMGGDGGSNDSETNDADGAMGGGLAIESRWHTDVTFVPNPPAGSILRGVVVPPYGGDTQWTNLAVAYQRLSKPIRQMIDGLRAVHHNTLPIARGEMPGALAKTFLGDGIRSIHPMVRVHPETNERVLFVNPGFTSHVVELSRQEGKHLLAMLYEHLSNPEFTVRFRWEPGSVAFWDNRATAHLVPTDIPPGMHRSMQRIALAGDPPSAPTASSPIPWRTPATSRSRHHAPDASSLSANRSSRIRRKPSVQPTVHGPVKDERLALSAMEPRSVPGTSCTTTSASRPMSSPTYAHHCCTLTPSSPAQFTIVAGTLAASSRAAVCSLMSSW
jgi:alpha-ketoglutarate-dependent sulfate ester dioxygenase